MRLIMLLTLASFLTPGFVFSGAHVGTNTAFDSGFGARWGEQFGN